MVKVYLVGWLASDNFTQVDSAPPILSDVDIYSEANPTSMNLRQRLPIVLREFEGPTFRSACIDLASSIGRDLLHGWACGMLARKWKNSSSQLDHVMLSAMQMSRQTTLALYRLPDDPES